VSRDPNDQLLREVAKLLGRLSVVTEVRVFPPSRPNSVVADLPADQYPDRVETVFLEVEHYRNGEFHVSYVEHWETGIRTCRWDRHENPHNDSDHFHPFPDAGTAIDREYPSDFFAVLEIVLGEIDERRGTVFEIACDD
jgi:hypothetical protein